MEPIFSLDTVSVVKNKKIEFLPKCESSFGINTWNLELRNNDSVIQRWGGNNI
ncbi:hypothetical protein SDC9_160378 [bioreactor metagenome]|uniref:Uncharacterized protein n=1 Tax=bioreactor metagenome TaxID=1076179 RepID=A0A645FF82_9ZZZZ